MNQGWTWDWSQWGMTEWVIVGVSGFALLMGLSAMGSAGKRLRGGPRIWK